MKPKISIILTSYNRTKFLLEAIQSIENQTMRDIELIIIDDASDVSEVHMILDNLDDMLTIPYKLIKNEKNINNIAINWNKGVDVAQGEYICLLDSDNRKLPIFCEEMSKYIDDNKDCDAAACLSEFIDEKGENTGQIRFPHFGQIELRKNVMQQNLIDSGEIMFRRTSINKFGYFDERLTTSEDWDFIINFVTLGNVGFVDKVLTQYRNHSDRRMHSKINEGDIANKEILRTKKRGKLKFAVIVPPHSYAKTNDICDNNDRLTRSQIQVVTGCLNGLSNISYLDFSGMFFSDKLPEKVNADYVFCIAPFKFKIEEMEKISLYGVSIINIHMEDPQAFNENIKRDYFADWIITNDLSYFNLAKLVVRKNDDIYSKNRIIYSPVLLTDEKMVDDIDFPDRDIDILFCGYAYDTRKEFMKELTKKLPEEFNLTIIGDGWNKEYFNGLDVRIYSTLNMKDTMNYFRRSRTIVCCHRADGELGCIDKIKAESVYRGYYEMYSGALVFIDDYRKHSLLNDEVVFYSNIDDLVSKLICSLSADETRKKVAKIGEELAKREFTYQNRMPKLMNYIRSNRMGMKT